MERQQVLKDEQGNFRFVYSDKDAQAGRNVNAIILDNYGNACYRLMTPQAIAICASSATVETFSLARICVP